MTKRKPTITLKGRRARPRRIFAEQTRSPWRKPKRAPEPHPGSDLRNLKLDGAQVVGVRQNTGRSIIQNMDCLTDVLFFKLDDGRTIRYERIFQELGPINSD